ncbi:phosphoglycerate mutase [Pseudoxanthomonas gei]|uniref:Phosphoglycerate mutase n=1 Tax=Pseudoxanthomonas gei TaxID=1383030 RepID=A0ABX0A9N0_9GAMM|nr:phosphoglycerate mutase [Pseudoxanthomonas gei]NDK37357.1 phosphoglycerate mutase [Pseudoxanthomonas gei]
MASATLLLPLRSRFAGQALPAGLAGALARADRDTGDAGERAQLRRHFQLIPDHWPVAALTRQRDAGDAAQSSWLRVDPAHVAPDMGGARMLSHGEALALTAEDVAQLLPALRPLFGDAGFTLDAPHPARWYLRLPRESKLPAFASPDEVLGEDLFAHLPEGDLGRRWRALLTEAQVILHNHPWNAMRISLGKPAVNSLWFWGAGAAPDFVRTHYRQVKGNDILLRSLAGVAGVVDGSGEAEEVDALVDLRHLRDLAVLARDAVQPLMDAVRKRELQSLSLDFEDGAIFHLRRDQRWRFWRKPLSKLDA